MGSNDTLHLKQHHWLFGTRELKLNPQQQLMIRERSWIRRDETVIPLGMLSPHPSYSKSFSIRWLLFSIFMLAITAACTVGALQFALIWLWFPALLFACGSLLTLYRFLLYTTSLVVFRHYQTQEFLLYLWKDKPNAARFRFFVDELDSRLQRIKR